MALANPAAVLMSAKRPVCPMLHNAQTGTKRRKSPNHQERTKLVVLRPPKAFLIVVTRNTAMVVKCLH